MDDEQVQQTGTTDARRGTSRRGLLGLTGAAAGAAALGLGAADPAVAAPRAAGAPVARGTVDLDGPRFTVVVIPDTQYLFDGDSLVPAPLNATVDWVAANRGAENIVFAAHLGDVVQNAAAKELAVGGPALRRLASTGVPWSVLAGNHDIDGSTDDTRGRTPWLDQFGPARLGARPGYATDPSGYNSAHRFRAGGRDWLLLALDWRVSAAGLTWASKQIEASPTTPAILTIHELVNVNAAGEEGFLSDFGQSIWDGFIRKHDQILFSLNGHYWPPARTTKRNDAGHDVPLHLVNYQDRYYGGAAMIRLYRFDLERRTIDVSTVNPYFEHARYRDLDELAREEIELTTDVDRFQMDLDPAVRFAGFDPRPARPARPASAVTVPGTLALWGRFGAGSDGGRVDSLRDLTGKGNDLVAAHRAGARSDALTWSPDHHPDSPSRGSIRFQGGKAAGDHLRTVDGAALATAEGRRGYTIELFFKLPADWGGDDDWSAALSRRGSAGSAGKTGGYSTTEPLANISFSNLVEIQWNAYPLNLNGSVTNWSHLLPLDTWWHVAVVNDGRMTRMFVDGSEVVRNPVTRANGIATTGLGWLLGGLEDDGKLAAVHNGWIGDVRIVDRALQPERFLIA